MYKVRVPKNKGPQIVVTNRIRTVFEVDANDVVQCETDHDADMLVALIDGAVRIESESTAPTSSSNKEQGS